MIQFEIVASSPRSTADVVVPSSNITVTQRRRFS
jgi:hypothetical protein